MDIKSILSSIDLNTTTVIAVRAKTEDKTLNASNSSYVKNVDPAAEPKKLADIDPRFYSERKSKTNPDPKKAQKVFKDSTHVILVGGQFSYREENAKRGGTSLLEAADNAQARKAEGKVFKSNKKWVNGFGPVVVEGQFLPCSDGTPSPIEVTSRAGVLLCDEDDETRLTLVGATVDGLKSQVKAAGVSIPETVYSCEDGSSINPYDEQYKEFRSYAESKREPVTPVNILAENIESIEVLGTWNTDGTITMK